MLVDPLVIVVARTEVETGDVTRVLGMLNDLMATPEKALLFQERVDIAFHGYDHDPRELFEISEVRHFAYRLDSQFPYWLFFLSKHGLGLQCLLYCLLPPFLTEEAKTKILPKEAANLFMLRWFPAMNHVCKFVGSTVTENVLLTERANSYLTKGRLTWPERN